MPDKQTLPQSNRPRVVILSAFQDYRTPKRASIHQVSHALAEDGYDVSFISTRFSLISKKKGDSRLFLWNQSNEWHVVDGIRCYLWRTTFHPFATGSAISDALMARLFSMYSMFPNKDIDEDIISADYIIIESSVSAIYINRIKRLNSSVKIIYYATDRLDTVGAHPYVRQELIRKAHLINHFCLRSVLMAPDFTWAKDRLYRADFGIDLDDFSDVGKNPYTNKLNAVSVGSMLFDKQFFQEVAPHFPDVHFHVIGCGSEFKGPDNVTIYKEMPFRKTIPYIRYADVGIAPYRLAPGVEYLADSSLKLGQYEYLQVPAVCPNFAVGTNKYRFGYTLNDAASMVEAMMYALAAAGTIPARHFPSWTEVADQVLHPERYPDARIEIE
ncbi:MAG: glycosyltransferase family 1 protein [Sphingomonas sp.]|nr:MAG: glycosyltransferase family 1 protein [Sphingomonas sp.]